MKIPWTCIDGATHTQSNQNNFNVEQCLLTSFRDMCFFCRLCKADHQTCLLPVFGWILVIFNLQVLATEIFDLSLYFPPSLSPADSESVESAFALEFSAIYARPRCGASNSASATVRPSASNAWRSAKLRYATRASRHEIGVEKVCAVRPAFWLQPSRGLA